MQLVLRVDALSAGRSFEVELSDPARPGEVVGWTEETVRAADALAVRSARLETGERLAVVRPAGGLGPRAYRVVKGDAPVRFGLSVSRPGFSLSVG